MFNLLFYISIVIMFHIKTAFMESANNTSTSTPETSETPETTFILDYSENITDTATAMINVNVTDQETDTQEPNVTTSTQSTPATPGCICGISTVNDDNVGQRMRMIGGHTAKPHAYPWHAVLQYYHKTVCSGTLINDQYVLTAAHCIIMLKVFQRKLEYKYRHRISHTKNASLILEKMSIVLGAYNSTVFDEQTVGVVSYEIHSDHKVDSVHDVNDIALIKLDRIVNFTADVSPVCLPNQGEDFSGQLGIIVGWGKTHVNGEPLKFLRHGSVHILADPICVRSRIGSHFIESPDTMICAYEYQIDACQGDSGGPLLYKRSSGSYFQIGITSWGIDCAKVGYPGVYTEVAAYIDWIEKHTNGSVYCSKPKD